MNYGGIVCRYLSTEVHVQLDPCKLYVNNLEPFKITPLAFLIRNQFRVNESSSFLPITIEFSGEI